MHYSPEDDLQSPSGIEMMPEYDFNGGEFRQELEKKKGEFYSSGNLDEPLLEPDIWDDQEGVGGTLDLQGTYNPSIGISPYIEAPGARRPSNVKLRVKLKRASTYLPLQISLLILLIIDITATVALAVLDASSRDGWWPGGTLRTVSLVISIVFFTEMVVIRLAAHGVYLWLLHINTPTATKVWRMVRILILAMSMMMEVVFYPGGRIAVQTAARSVRIIVVGWEKLTSGAKIGENTVSACRRRYIAGGFDLDLTYITDQIIAMSWPSVKIESLYRNRINEVASFLDAKHYEKYKVYNLCSERHYTPHYFHNRVERFNIDDHQPCNLSIIYDFCVSASEYLDADIQHVIIVHCKGGKGRTGMMICSHLVWSGVCQSVEDARERFGLMRTEIGSVKVQTVESPSQNLYLKYFEQCLTNVGLGIRCIYNPPPPRTLTIDTVVVGPIPNMYSHTVHKFVAAVLNGSEGVTLWSSDNEASGTRGSRTRRSSKVTHPSEYRQYTVLLGNDHYPEVQELSPAEYAAHVESNKKTKEKIWLRFDLAAAPPVTGDTRFHLVEEGNTWAESVIWTWFHTSFVDPATGIYLTRPNVDGAHKDNEHRKFLPDFTLRIRFKS
eukprot:TRINITY_DN6723_c0_g1_i1.p1 TRINITY_DN6723_c0_g1~~TRINITY_DN6723_c0_g1_i1.p1  ORF type:complete len:610 (+),score=95.20 TRINITY_DN6723_c0_g1_i1:49-1878(+)